MNKSVFDNSCDEASLRVAFSGNRIDRQSEARTDDSAQAALRRPDARLLLMGEGRICLRIEGEDRFRPYFPLSEVEALGGQVAEAVLLGHEAGVPMLAVPFAGDPEALPEDVKAIDFRSVYTQGLLDASALGAMAQGGALLAWHANHRFCGRCGGETAMRDGGYKRVCAACGREHFPRTDPVVIMLTVRNGRCLLGRGPHFAPGMISCLAGFVEPGETIEAAVRRETLEESSIAVGRVSYHASQPWPFPYTLMIGCYAEGLSDAVEVDAKELETCRWFTREEVLAMIDGNHPEGYHLPPPGAIASVLIRDWASAD